MRRNLCVIAAIYLAFVALVGVDVLLEQVLGLKGPSWLDDIFPLGIGGDPSLTAIVTIAAIVGAAILFRIAKKS